MQRRTDEGVIIACDFTGEDWDGEAPMIEGHHGSVLSLDGLAMAVEHAGDHDEPFTCTMCLRRYDEGGKAWQPDPPPAHGNPEAIICWDCVQQADKAFDRDPDTDWVRHIPPDDRWR